MRSSATRVAFQDLNIATGRRVSKASDIGSAISNQSRTPTQATVGSLKAEASGASATGSLNLLAMSFLNTH